MPVGAELGGTESERDQEVGARVHDGRHDQGVELDVTAVGEPDPGEVVVAGQHLGHDAGHDADPPLRKHIALLGRGGCAVGQHGDVRAEQPEHHRLVHRHRCGGQHAHALVAHLVAVAEAAVHDVLAPPFGQAGHVGELVATAGGGDDAVRGHRPVLELQGERPGAAGGRADGAGDDVAAETGHLAATDAVQLRR